VGAERSVTWIFGYAFSKALISTVRGSGVDVVIGLAHQTMVPLVADPGGLAEPPPDALGVLDDELPHAASASVRAAASEAAIARPRGLRTVMLYFLLYLEDPSVAAWAVTDSWDGLQLARRRRDGCSGLLACCQRLAFRTPNSQAELVVVADFRERLCREDCLLEHGPKKGSA